MNVTVRIARTEESEWMQAGFTHYPYFRKNNIPEIQDLAET